MSLDELLDHVRTSRALPDPAERRAIRRRAGLSLHQVANAVGVTPTALANWETGRRGVSERHLKTYVEILQALEQELR